MNTKFDLTFLLVSVIAGSVLLASGLETRLQEICFLFVVACLVIWMWSRSYIGWSEGEEKQA